MEGVLATVPEERRQFQFPSKRPDRDGRVGGDDAEEKIAARERKREKARERWT